MHNRITHLKNNEGTQLETHKDMENTLVSFYEDLLTKNEQDRGLAIQEVTYHIPSLVTGDQNSMLMRPTML